MAFEATLKPASWLDCSRQQWFMGSNGFFPLLDDAPGSAEGPGPPPLSAPPVLDVAVPAALVHGPLALALLPAERKSMWFSVP